MVFNKKTKFFGDCIKADMIIKADEMLNKTLGAWFLREWLSKSGIKNYFKAGVKNNFMSTGVKSDDLWFEVESPNWVFIFVRMINIPKVAMK